MYREIQNINQTSEMTYNILIYNYREFNVNIGGIERISVSLANSLLEHGYNIVLVAIYRSKYTIPYTTPVPIIFLPSYDTDSNANIESLRKLIIERKVDIVIDQDVHSLASHQLCYNAIQGTSAKLISALHFSPSQRLQLYKHPYDKNIFTLKENIIRILKSVGYKYPFSLYTLKGVRQHFSQIYTESDKVVLLSKNFIPEFARLGRLTESGKIVGINNMLSFPLHYEQIDKEKRILFCAQLSSAKRPERVLYIWAQLQERLPDWSLDFVGDGPLLPRLVSLSKKLKLKNIEFYGYKDSKSFYSRARISLLTSDHEGWALTLTEAMQNRCVPVAMNTYASASEIIDDGINGYLIPNCDCTAMADKVYELATNESLWNEMSQAAYRKMEQFTPENIVAKWIDLFDQVKAINE